MPEQTRLPAKKDVARALLLRGSVFVHLDPRSQGVVVPEWLRDQPQLVLQIGLDMPIPIPDLRIDDQGVYGTLSFQRSPFTCEVAWDTVFALVGEDGRGMVWPEDLPSEIAAEVAREGRGAAPGATASEPPPMAVIDGEGEGAEDDEASVTSLDDARERKDGGQGRSGSKSGKRRELPPYLRVIK